MEQALKFQNTKGTNLAAILSNPTGSTDTLMVILCHGHSSTKNTKNYVKLTELLNKEGISTFRFDIYGHGESEGEFENATVSEAVDDIVSAVKYLKEKGYSKLGLVGSSFGGIASTIAASRIKDLQFLALKSPVSNYADFYFWRGTPIAKWKEQGYRDYKTKKGMLKLNYSFYEDAIINDGYTVAPSITIPTLILHGDADTEVLLDQSIKLAKLLPNGKLEIIKGADHSYTNESHAEQMLGALVAFILTNK